MFGKSKELTRDMTAGSIMEGSAFNICADLFPVFVCRLGVMGVAYKLPMRKLTKKTEA